jgi:uncharacterized protein YabE (DUF348 family)
VKQPVYHFLPSQHIILRGIFLFIVLAVVLVASTFYARAQVSPKTRVTVHENNTVSHFDTNDSLLGSALQNAGVSIGKYDSLSVDPSTTLTGVDVEVTVQRAYPITIIDGNMEFQTYTSGTTVEKVLTQLRISTMDTDIITPSLNTSIGQGTRIIITRSHSVLVSDGKKNIETGTQENTVGDVLKQLKISLRPQDLLEPPSTTEIHPGLHIIVTRVDTRDVTEVSPVSFLTINQNDPTLYHGTTRVGQAGVNGERTKTFRVTTHNGNEVSRSQLTDIITKKPVTQIIRVGTKERVGRVMSGLATWYVNGSGLTCASRDFPDGTRLRVTNLANGRQVIVVVNDYGPSAGSNRIIDLNKNAFAAIGSVGAGVLNVKIEQLL